MPENNPIVYVVDDDPSIRDALDSLIRSVGFRAQTFASAQGFLRSVRPDALGCLVLDGRLPGLSGLDLQRELARVDIRIPIIFITGHGDIPMSVSAMKAGAVEFLTKPFRDQDLLDAIQAAIDRDRARMAGEAALADLSRRFAELTGREREVMRHVVAGRANKQIAYDLGVSEATIKAHRGQVMEKMGARSVAQLVRLADKLDPQG